MSDSNSQPGGPDFTNGVSASDVPDGGTLLGHVGDDAVLLAKMGDDFFAVGATCTHYGGPLAEGVVVDEEVRCPWHHACFSLRTGEALRAPALNPLPCWKVERRGDTVVVTTKQERDPLSPVGPAPQWPGAPRQIVIVGAGAAGASATEMLRRLGYEGGITMIDAEADSPYDRPNLSKDYLAGNAPEEWIPLRPPGFYTEHGVEVVRARATRIDSANRRVEVEGRDPVPFDALLLATGAEPVHLPIPGSDNGHVHYLRSLADSRAIIAAAEDAKRAVVMGASFIGLETAASLRTRGLEVHVVAPEELPLERVMGSELGTFIKNLHESHGVVFHLKSKAASIDAEGVTLEGGERIAADLVVIGVGVRPRLALAEQAGLTMDRGVAVNEYLETSAAGIYAAGDIARWPDPHTGERIRVEHWVVAERQGQTAARNLLSGPNGQRERFDAVPFFWSAHYDVSINYVGHAEKWDRVDVDGNAEDRDVAVRFVKGDRTLAVATIFRDTESLNAELEMERAVTS